MYVEVNEMLAEWFVGTYYGFLPPQEVIESKISNKVSHHRQGQVVSILGEFQVKGTSNIICHRKEFFEPISWKNIQEYLQLKDQAFRTFKRDMIKLNRIKEVNNILYVNPSFIISYDMDYLRDDLISIFKEDKAKLEIINEYLKGLHGKRTTE